MTSLVMQRLTSRLLATTLPVLVGMLAAAIGEQASAVQSSPPPASTGQPPPSTIPDRVVEMKRSLEESRKALKAYEWIETTVVMVKDEEKSRVEQRCYYGADGKVQKLPVTAPEEPKHRRGIRGRIAEGKKAELTAYMRQAVELMHKYLPPDPELIQKVKEAGNVSIDILEPGKRIRLEFNNYLIPGDVLSAEMLLEGSRLATFSVSSFLDHEDTKSHEKDPVKLEAKIGRLDDGSSYVEESVLEAAAKDLKVIISNSGHRKIDT